MAKQVKIDIKGGDITFGQRIEVGRIISDNSKTEMQMFEETFECLYGSKPKIGPTNVKKYLLEFEEIIEGILFWIEKEKTLLKYDPSPEEIRAGINDLAAKIGEFGTVKAIAKAYSLDPDEVLKWKYGKVFGILYTDLEEHKFQVKLHKQQMESVKRGNYTANNKR